MSVFFGKGTNQNCALLPAPSFWHSANPLFNLTLALAQIIYKNLSYFPRIVERAMIIKSKRNKVIDRRLIPGNWFNLWLYKVLALWVSYSWCLCYTLWLGTLKATGSCILAWDPLWVCWYTCIYVLQCDCILCLYAFKIVLVGACINPVLHF